MAVYTNDLRLKEIATGDESGTWGTSTNTNLSLIAEAFSFGTEAITTNADTHTTTIADGGTDPGRSIFLKYTGTLDSACTITIGPNTVSKLWLIQNSTSGSQSIIIKQGSGATITIPNGQTKAIYSDGAGSGGAMVDAFQDLSIPDLFIDDDLTVGDDLTVTGLATIGETLAVTGVLTANAGVVVDNITIDGTEIDLSSGDLTIDVAGDITLDAGGANINFSDDGTAVGHIEMAGQNLEIKSKVSDKDILLKGNDGGSAITALTLDMSEAGIATFNSGINIGNRGSASDPTLQSSIDPDTGVFWGGSNILGFSSGGAERLRVSSEVVVNDPSNDVDFRVESNGNTHMLFVDGGSDHVNIGTSTDYDAVLNVLSTDNNKTLSLVSTDTDANAGPVLALTRQSSSSAADGDILGRIDFEGLNDANQQVAYGRIQTFIRDASDGTEDGTLQINHFIAGSQVIALELDNDEYVFNNGSNDIDFRVESDGNANAFFVDAGNNKIGLFSSSPTETITFDGSSSSIFEFRTGTQAMFRPPNNDNDHRIVALTSNGLDIVHGGATTTSMQRWQNQTGVVFNEDSVDQDFRIESNGNTHALFVDAGNEVVLIGKSAVSGSTVGVQAKTTGELSVVRDGNHALILNRKSDDGDIALFQKDGTTVGSVMTNGGAFVMKGNSASAPVQMQTVDGNEDIEVDPDGFIKFETAGSERVRIDSAGATTFSGNVKASDILASGSGGLSLQTDDGVKRITLEDSGTITLGNNSLAAATTLNARRTTATGDILRITGGNSNVSEFANILLHADNVTGGTQTGLISLSTIDVAAAGDATLREKMRITNNSIVINESSLDHDFRVESNNDTHALFLDAGNDRFIVGASSATAGTDFVSFDARPGATGQLIQCGRDDASLKNQIIFTNPNGTVGSVQTSGTATAYNTSSDERLKENITDAEDAGAKVDRMKVRQFDWKTDGAHQDYGMVAQELNEVAPEAVSQGENEDEMWAVDYSKLVPMLVKEIQSLRNRVAELEGE